MICLFPHCPYIQKENKLVEEHTKYRKQVNAFSLYCLQLHRSFLLRQKCHTQRSCKNGNKLIRVKVASDCHGRRHRGSLAGARSGRESAGWFCTGSKPENFISNPDNLACVFSWSYVALCDFKQEIFKICGFTIRWQCNAEENIAKTTGC